MKYNLIIVRYGEIALKGRETRKHFENSLIRNIRNALKTKNIKFTIRREWGRIYVYTDQISRTLPVLQKVFGITSISPALETQSDMNAISKLAIKISKPKLTHKASFAIRATRTGKHDYTSQDVAVKIGDKIVKITSAKVNLSNPDFELFIEIRDDKAFVFTEKVQGTGGLPLGTQGNVLSLIDEPKSLLAAWYLIRRGCAIIFVNTIKYDKFLNSFIEQWCPDSEVIIFDSGDSDLYENLIRIALDRNCDAIITGHSIYDNNSNVLSEIKHLKKHFNLPVLHPLIAMEKDELIKKCKEIGITL